MAKLNTPEIKLQTKNIAKKKDIFFSRYATTPMKRTGIIFLIISLFVLFSTALYWNIFKKPFIYKYSYPITEKIPKPTEKPEGTYWEEYYKVNHSLPEEISGWSLYNEACVKKGKAQPLMIFPSSSIDKCKVKFIPHKYYLRSEWRHSFDQYWNIYFRTNIIAFVLLLSGAAMCLGIVDKLLSWIKTGK